MSWDSIIWNWNVIILLGKTTRYFSSNGWLLHVVTFLTACRNEGFNSKKRLDSFTNSVDFTHCLSLAGYFDEN